MNDAFNLPRTALVIGGTSDIAVAIIDRLATHRLQHLVLASRDRHRAQAVSDRLRNDHEGLQLELAHFDASEVESHAEMLDSAAELLGDIDLVLVAAGSLGTPDRGVGPLGDWTETVDVARSTYVGPISAVHLAANMLHAQGHGTLAVISSVAALRPRRTNPAYGAAKAALDGYTLALADRFHDSGVHVMLIRPGFVRTRMTAGLEGNPPPFATTTDRVADDVIRGLRRRQRIVWSPLLAAGPGLLARFLPGTVMRRLPW